MTEPTEIKANVPITLQLDLEQLLASTVGTIPAYTGDPDDEMEQPPPLYGEIINAAANILARRISRDERTSYRTRYHVAINEKLAELVTAELEKPFNPVDTYGEVIRGAAPTSLREQIGKIAQDAFVKGMDPGRTYNGHRESVGALRKYIDSEIDKQIKGELQAAVQEGKALVVDRIKATAAQVVTDTITKGVR